MIKKAGWMLIVGSAGLIASCSPYGPGPFGPGSMRGSGGMYFGYGGYAMWILLLIVIAIVIALAVRSGGAKSSSSTPDRETPLDILKKRYARGEISKEQYDEMKRNLQD